LQTNKPKWKLAYIHGYSAGIAGRQIQLRERKNFVQEPFRPKDLQQTIHWYLNGKFSILKRKYPLATMFNC